MGKNYIDIMSKVSKDAYQRLNRIKELYGFDSVYQIMQYLVSSFLRVADPEGQSNEDHDLAQPVEIAGLFQNLEKIQSWSNDVKPSASHKLQLSGAVYMFSGSKNKYGVCRYVRFASDGSHSSTVNKHRAFDALLRFAYPEIYRSLKDIKETNGLVALSDAVQLAIGCIPEELTSDTVTREIRDEFRRHENHEPTPENTIKNKKGINESLEREERREYARKTRPGLCPDFEQPEVEEGTDTEG